NSRAPNRSIAGSSVIHRLGSKSGRSAMSSASTGSAARRNARAFCSTSARPTPTWPSRLGVAIPRSLLPQPVSENDLDHICDGVLTSPVALELACQRDPADRLPARLDHALQAGAVRLERCSANGIDHRIHLIPLAKGV